jgi:hypothetical protein
MQSALSRSFRVAGAVLLLGGLAHAAGVAHKYATLGWSERHRAGFVAFIGLAHLTGGALDWLAARTLRRDEPSATLVAAIAAVFTIAWTALDLPILFAEAKLFFQIMPIVYLVTHAALLLTVALRRAR